MKKKGVGKSDKNNLKNSKKENKKITEEKLAQKKPEIKKQESNIEFSNDSESFFNTTTNSYGEEALEQVIPKKRFMPILSSAVKELEDSFEEIAPVNLEKSLKDVPSLKDNPELSPSYATTKNIEYGPSKYNSKTSSSYETHVDIGPTSHIGRGPENSTWRDMNSTNPEPGVNPAIGRNRDYENISKKKRDVW